LKQIHDAIPSPYGHPNFMIPIGISVSGYASAPPLTNDSTSNIITSSDKVVYDPIISLFQSADSDGNKSDTENETSHGSAYVLFSPTPFVLNRFISRKMRTSDDSPLIGGTILASWFHDIVSALVHCHENHILLRTVSSDQIFVDHSGVAMFGALYRCSVIPVTERSRSKDPLELLKSTKDRKKAKDNDNDMLDDPFAAPEILLGSPAHSKASDIWSVGSLLASLLLNKPFFTGKDRESLLTSQYKIVGTPSTDNFANGVKYPHYSKPMKKYKRGVEKALEHLLKENTPQYQKAIDLISRMLHLDSKKRCTAVEALGHEYMSEYIENCQSDEFRKQFAVDWINLKRRVLHLPVDDPGEQSRKRDAMIRSVSTRATGGDEEEDDDDLYNIDFLDNSSSSKRVKFED
jgi:serine/threonine protein kinase